MTPRGFSEYCLLRPRLQRRVKNNRLSASKRIPLQNNARKPMLRRKKFHRQPTHSLFPTLLRGSELLRLACNSLKIRLPVPFSCKPVAEVRSTFASSASTGRFITVHKVRNVWTYASTLYGLTASGFVRIRLNPSCPSAYLPARKFVDRQT